MRLGKHLRELWRLRAGVILCALLASFAAVSACFKIGLAPPGLTSRSLETATASTQVLVDTPTSSVLDLRQGTSEISAMTNRALLLGNIMASRPVRQFIGRRAGVPAEVIQAATPLTSEFPRPMAEAGNEKHTTDILRSTEQYRLSIRANPTVPIILVYAQAPTKEVAERLANGAVDGLRDYLGAVADAQQIGVPEQVRVEQLGRAHGAVINKGVGIQAGLLSFIFVFSVSGAALVFLSRVRRGWAVAKQAETDSINFEPEPSTSA
jgi:hypothetical protein